MENENKKESCCECGWHGNKKWQNNVNVGGGAGGGIYFFGFVGAAVYFISQTTSFWMGVLGFLKAIAWPAFFVYEGLKMLIK